ncbi:MAG: InlB B-repeat-containing protein, partial [Paludibacteraceae bacterium]|nr:InlB B-repeat-containing protein [Paludibacteraceae bacterium]
MLKKAIFLSIFAFAFVTSASAAINPVTPPKDSDECYAIGTKEELYGFARLLNEAYEANYSDPILASCAKLIQNITVNSKVLNADGELANDPASYEMWTPISQFNGIFDGQGHAISGLFIIADGDAGLFRSVDGATIKNIGIIDAFVEGSGSGNGAFAGHSNFNGSMSTTTTFENAYVKNSLIVSDCYAGGLVGWSYFNLVIKNSYNDNTAVFSYKNDYNYAAGGLIGIANQNVAVTNSFVTGKVTAPNAGGVVGTFQGNLFSFVNSFVSGKISGTHMAGSVVGYRANDYEPISTEHSYQLNDIVSMDETCWMPSRVVNMNLVAAYDIKWGALAAKLRDYNENGVDGSVWGQNFSKNEDHPTLSGSITSAPASSKLTLVTYTGDVTAYPTIYVHGQSNNALPIAARDGYKFMGWYTNISFAGEPVEFVPTTAIGDKIYYAKLVDMKDENGCYAIETVDELYYFASVVNNGEVSACGKLMNNIVINENVIKDGVLNGDGSNFRQWNPIGNIGKNPPFMGIFDGQGYTISGLYVNMNRGNLGLFGFVSGTSVQIKNLKVVDSYVSSTVGGNNIGGIVGNVGGALSLDDVSFSGIVSSPNSYDVGGLVGNASGVMGTVSMNRVSFAGTVMGNSEIGGILGKNYGVDLLINEASFEGLARAPSGYVGGIVGNSSTYDGISLKIENSVSAGTIESNNSYYAGGFIGIAIGNTKISKGKNYASVNGPDYVGGFVGYVSNLELVNSYNSGNVTASGRYAGGLVGQFNGSYIANCYNVGDVTGSDYVGGLAGNAYDMAILNSFHYGNVQGIGYDVGAVVGYADDNAFFENVFYVGASGNQYGSSVLKSLFDNGVLASVMKAYNSEYADGSVWGQNVVNGDAYPTLSGAIYGGATASKGSLTLRLSDGTEVTDEYIEGISKNLPKFIGDTQVLFWSSKEDLNDEIAAVPASSKGNFVAYGRALAIKIVDDCYQISNVDELYEFAEIVNRGEKNVCGNLVKDIVINEGVLNENLGLNDKEYRLWTPIGNTSHNYFGSFDGQGHVISGLVTKNDDYAGLFGIAATATIKNVGIEDSYIQGTKYAGGIVAYADVYTFELTNSYSVAVVRVAEDGKAAGGLVGGLGDYSPYLVANCFHIGEVSGGKISGGIAGNSYLYSVYNSYHDESSGYDQYLALLDDGFKKGTVAKYLHNYNENSVDGSIWGQDPSKGDWHPNFSGKVVLPKAKVVYHLSDGTDVESTYNEGSDNALPTIVDGKEIIAWVKEDPNGYGYGYETVSNIYSWNSGNLEFYGLIHSIKKVDGCYEITNGSELYEFAYIISSEMDACGKLTEDIVVNEKVLNSDGTLNTENVKLRQWTPIGSWGNPFKGTFDGQGHSISGLYFKMETVEQYGSNRIGLFGYVESSDNETVSIKNLVVKDSYIWGYEYVGGIIGEARDVHLEVEACGFEGFVNAQNSTAAGIIGFADETRIGSSSIVVQNSYNQGTIKSYDRIGGIIGATYVETLVLSTYNVGVIEGQSKTGEIIGFAKDGAVSMAWNNYFIGTEDDAFGSAKTAEEFADGSVVTILRGSENLVWGQNVADGDKYPNFSGKIKKTKMQTDDDGCYLVASSDDLYEFAKVVDVDGEVFACGKLTADIVVNENVLDAEGNLENNDISTYKLWNPIGSVKYFSGTFDGQGHTIAGLITDENSMYGGLFGYVNGGEKEVSIRNVGVVDSYIQGAATGGIIGISQAKQIVVENIFVVASVKAVVGPEFSGMIPADQTIAGGIVAVADGLNLSNCYFVGKISSAGFVDEILAMPMGAVLVSKAYFVGVENSKYGTAMSLDDFANGSVAALLRGSDENSIWGQNVTAGDKYPNFSG